MKRKVAFLLSLQESTVSFILTEVPDNKADFRLEFLHNLPFVKIQQERKAKKVTQKVELMTDMQDVITELKEVLSGRKESCDVYDFLKELESTDE